MDNGLKELIVIPADYDVHKTVITRTQLTYSDVQKHS